MSENSTTQPSSPPSAQAQPPAAAALDKIAQEGGLHKLMHQAESYVNRAVEGARPYAEAVQQRTGAIVQGGAAGGAEGKGLLEQGLGRVQATFTQVTHAIDQRTATEKHPGLVTMLAQATTSMIEKVDRAMDASIDNPASTSAAAAAVAPLIAPERRTSTSAAAVPVVTSGSNAPGPSFSAPAAAAAAADAELVTSGPNTASTSSAPVHEGEKPVTTTTNMVVHSD